MTQGNQEQMTPTADAPASAVAATTVLPPKIHHAPGLGKYIIPDEDTLDAHHAAIYRRANELDFWAEQSPAFDSLVAQTFLDPAFSKPNHPRYFDYEPLRDNVATVRNYVLGKVLEGVDLTDPAQKAAATKTLEQMGREIGVALQRDTITRRPGSDHIDVLAASEPGVGAAKIYALLVEKQEKNKTLHDIKATFGFDYSAWNLPPVEQSPFSKANVEAFCIKTNSPVPSAPEPEQESPMQAAAQQEPVHDVLTHAKEISVLAATVAGSAASLSRVEKLPEPVKARSVELAREILEKLKINKSNVDRDAWLSQDTQTSVVEGNALASVSEVYAQAYMTAMETNPEIANNPVILEANTAIGQLSCLMKQQAAHAMLEAGQRDDAQQLLAELQTYPQEWLQDDTVSLSSLLEKMQAGLDVTLLLQQSKGQEQQVLAELKEQKLTPQQLHELLQNNGLTPQELAAVREQMHHSTQSTPTSAQEQLRQAIQQTKAAKHEADKQPSPTQEPISGFRHSVKQQSREGEVMKR